MPPLKTALQATALTTVLASSFIYNRTKQSKIISPLSPTDPIFFSKFYLQNNPHRNPATQDVCVRRVPASKIKPGLVEAFLKEKGVQGGELDGGKGLEGKIETAKVKVERAVEGVKESINGNKESGPEFGLVEGFCAGIWSGIGYAYQRRYLSKKYEAQTPNQLWSRKDLKASNYEVGTLITDHFEVLDKTPERILVRCGDSPRNSGVRDSDGLFEIGVKIIEEPVMGWTGTLGAKERVVEFSLKSCLYKGLTKVEGTDGPMPWHVEQLHRLYSKLWMETAIYNVMQ